MIPEVGQHVKCIMRTSLILEGIVEEWSEAQVVLRSFEDQSLMIIHHPIEDIMLTKVMPAEPTVESPEIAEEEPEEKSVEIREQIKKKLQELPDDPELQNKSIQELRQMVIEQERQIIAQKRKEHFGSAGSAKMTQYSSPYQPRPHPRSNEKRSAYQPGTIPSWAYGRPPKRK